MLSGYLKKLTGIGSSNKIAEKDWVVVSYPKTGSTYTRFVLANVISGMYLGFREVNFYNLGEIMLEYGKDSLTKRWPYEGFPRVIKTHEIYSKKFSGIKNVLYIVRDPRDAMISYYHYMKAQKNLGYQGDINSFIKDKGLGLVVYNDHLESWYDHVSIFFKYEELMSNAFNSFKDFFELAGFEVQDVVLREAIRRSAPDYVKSIELKQGRPNQDKNFKKGFVFVRNAKTSQWKEEFNTEAVEYFEYNSSEKFSKKFGYEL
jgi:hypothetical protein